MIKSYKNAYTQQIANGTLKKGFPKELMRAAQRKLIMLDAATELKDLASPPGNQLEELKNKGKHKNRLGQYSIRINSQWRICFIWAQNEANEVEITDYH